MSLFSNAENLLGLFLNNQEGTETQKLAKRAEVSTGDFGKIAAVGLPLIMQAINRNTQNEQGLTSLNEALNDHQDVKNYDSLDQLTQNVDPQDGDNILGHVFNDKQSVFDRIGSTLGVSPSTVKRVLVLVAPLVLKYLADRRSENNLDKKGIQRETTQAAQEMNQTLRQKGQQTTEDEKDMGLIGDVFNALTKNKTSQSSTKSDKHSDKGLLGDILNLFDK